MPTLNKGDRVKITLTGTIESEFGLGNRYLEVTFDGDTGVTTRGFDRKFIEANAELVKPTAEEVFASIKPGTIISVYNGDSDKIVSGLQDVEFLAFARRPETADAIYVGDVFARSTHNVAYTTPIAATDTVKIIKEN